MVTLLIVAAIGMVMWGLVWAYIWVVETYLPERDHAEKMATYKMGATLYMPESTNKSTH